jgi:hypothetical protein
LAADGAGGEPRQHANSEYRVVNEAPALLWAVNLGSIGLHSSLHTRQDLHRPTVLPSILIPARN